MSLVDANGDLSSVIKAVLSDEMNNIDAAIAESPLLHSSMKCTLMETMVYLFDWFSSHPSLSKEAFSKSLHLWHTVLPEGNILPSNYQQAYRIIRPFLVPQVVFHVCVNDCILFREEYKDDMFCPKCKEPRFKRKDIPRRTFNYLPRGPRLIRSYGVQGIAEILQSHRGEKKGGVMHDIHDSPKWKNAYSEDGVFGSDPRGVSLSLCLDGLNPWNKNKATYSMWPIVLGQLNLPRNIRFRFENLLLVGIIPSQSKGKEPYHLDPFLEVLIDEIILLCSCQIYDAYQKALFNLKVELMLHVLDFQGMGKVFSLTGTGSYRACPWCMLKGQYCVHLRKVVYAGNRRFLPEDHPMRKENVNSPANQRSQEAGPLIVNCQLM